MVSFSPCVYNTPGTGLVCAKQGCSFVQCVYSMQMFGLLCFGLRDMIRSSEVCSFSYKYCKDVLNDFVKCIIYQNCFSELWCLGGPKHGIEIPLSKMLVRYRCYDFLHLMTNQNLRGTDFAWFPLNFSLYLTLYRIINMIVMLYILRILCCWSFLLSC